MVKISRLIIPPDEIELFDGQVVRYTGFGAVDGLAQRVMLILRKSDRLHVSFKTPPLEKGGPIKDIENLLAPLHPALRRGYENLFTTTFESEDHVWEYVAPLGLSKGRCIITHKK